jgi:hypothetical protein
MENNHFNLSGSGTYNQASSNVKTFMSNVFSWKKYLQYKKEQKEN